MVPPLVLGARSGVRRLDHSGIVAPPRHGSREQTGKLLFRTVADLPQQAVVSEAHELGRQDVEEEAADELGSIEGHQAEAVAMGVVLPAEK